MDKEDVVYMCVQIHTYTQILLSNLKKMKLSLINQAIIQKTSKKIKQSSTNASNHKRNSKTLAIAKVTTRLIPTTNGIPTNNNTADFLFINVIPPIYLSLSVNSFLLSNL